ncbi:MAG: T9SS type A sorting domain-containing protein [Flavobacteriaceae bacterium]|nr:T9SS type A sorting domain-containing protein [Flavobacteriaceae bacterium]
MLVLVNFQLFDLSGKLVETRKITSPTETICMDHLPAAYFLKVANNTKEVKIFKIIKN